MEQSHNEVSGPVDGPVVQARDISGGVYIHHAGAAAPGAGRSPAKLRPFWFANTAYTDPVELATAMALHWEEARAVIDDDRRQQLAAWLDMLDDAAVPVNWLSGDATSADEKLSQLIRHFAPDARIYLDRFLMDHAGIEELCRAAEEGDSRASFLLQRLDGRFLRVLAWHRCDHTDCVDAGQCRVIADVAEQLDLAAREFPAWPVGHYPSYLQPSVCQWQKRMRRSCGVC